MSTPGTEGRYTKIATIAGVISAAAAIIGLLIALLLPGTNSTSAEPAPAPVSTTMASTPQPPPPVGTTAEKESSATVTGAPLVTYLEDLEVTRDSDPYDDRGVAQVNGTSYAHSQGAKFCASQYERKWTYILGRKYDRFIGVAGPSDDSTAAARIRFEVVADGRPAFSEELQVGKSATLDVPVGDVLRVDLVTTLLTKEGRCGSLATGEWADVRAEASG